ncbi:MAG: hypothetical protein ACOY90_21780 [Candidatus Zhuqueibacterota bacterium]
MKRTLLSFLILCGLFQLAFAETFSIQGVLRDPLGRSVADGAYSLTFRIYDVAIGGTALWTETQGSVDVKHGVFIVELGSQVALTNLSFNAQYFLGISVEGDQELEPRMKLQKAPAAMSVFGTKNTFPSIGNVGVGIVSPAAGLHIKTQNTGDNLLKIESSAPGGGVMTVDANGKIGLNVTPEQALDINGNLKMRNGSILFDDGSSLSSAYFGGSASSLTNNGNVIITTDADDNGSGSVQVVSGATTVLTVANNGYVGIGTTNPTQPLTVNGTVTSSAMSVSGNVAANTLSGNGASITSLNASNLASGSVPSERINGSSVTNLNASNLSSGTVPNERLDSDLQDVANGSIAGCLLRSGIYPYDDASPIFYEDVYLAFRKYGSYVQVYLKETGNWTGEYLVSSSELYASDTFVSLSIANPTRNEWRYLENHQTSSSSVKTGYFRIGAQITYLIICRNSPVQYRLTISTFGSSPYYIGWQLIRFKN